MRNSHSFYSGCGLAAVGLTACTLMTMSAVAETNDEPDVLYLPGIVRDFMKSHPDFNVTTATGHIPNNVVHASVNYRPYYVAAGFEVANQWRNGAGQNIPPHLAMYGFGGQGKIPVSNPSNVPTGPHNLFDTYDSSAGPYGGDNIGPAPVYDVGAPMPTITVPGWLQALPNQGNVTFSGTTTLSQSSHFNAMTVTGTLLIDGNISILCQDRLHIATQGSIELLPGATLNIYLVSGAEEIAGTSWNHVHIGDELDPSRVHMYNLSFSELMIHNHASVWAIIISPNAGLSLTNHGELFGLFVGKQLMFDNHGKLHIDNAAVPQLCSSDILDTFGSQASSHDGAIASESTFEQWFSDHLGVNMSYAHTLELTRGADGVYEYMDNAFFPIDNRLFGNEGDAHNFNFTFSFTASFVHQGCEDLFIEFQGADDVWVYIDNALALDLGGVMAMTPQVAELDRLGLQTGQTYQLRFYYAQRNPYMSVFRLRTNVPLESSGPVGVTAMFD